MAGTTARCAADLVGIHRNTVAYYFMRLRYIISQQLMEDTPSILDGEIEVDESYFGGTCKGKRGGGSWSKIPVFGPLKRGGRFIHK